MNERHDDHVRSCASSLKVALRHGTPETVAEILDSVVSHNVKPNVWKLLSKAERAQIGRFPSGRRDEVTTP